MSDDAEPVVIRTCERCGSDRILSRNEPDNSDIAKCDCGETPLDALDLESLSDRGP